MTRTLRRFVVAVFVAVALFGVFASAAYATLEDTPTPTIGTSSSNPGTGADYWWRYGPMVGNPSESASWGNSVYPDFEFNPPGIWIEQDDGYLLGDIYTVDRTNANFRSSYINTSTPEAYYRTDFPTGVNPMGGTLTKNTLDLLGIYLNPIAGAWPAPPAGATSPLEGVWHYHYAFYSNQRYQNDSYTFGFGVDTTPPRPVTGLRVRTGLSATSDVTTWQPATRATISWDASETDSLSGDGYFQVLLDGKPYVPETSVTPTLGRVYCAPWLPTPYQVTIENVPAGHHRLGIQPVDRATNVGPPVTREWWSDPDTPTVSWADPLGSVLDPRTGVVSVNASDLAGDPTVNISIGTTATPSMQSTIALAPPYTLNLDTSALATGTYTLTATVKDHLNRTKTITKQVNWTPAATAGSASSLLDVAEPAGTSVDATGLADHWTNNLFPVVTLNAPDSATDVFYSVTSSPGDLDTSNLQNYLHSLRSDGTLTSKIVDILDSSAAPHEGTYYFNWVWYNFDNRDVSTKTYRMAFKIDHTPPTQVTGVSCTPADGVWTTSQRATLHWATGSYDALSGVKQYNVYVDGSLVATTGAKTDYPYATIEDMPTGAHRLGVAAEDRAGNVGPINDVMFLSDHQAPSLSFVEPTATLTPRNRIISVDATDDAGDPTVVIQLLHSSNPTLTVTLATLNSAPYVIAPDLSQYPSGSYTLRATATDGMGNSTVRTRAIFLDNNVTLAPDTAVDLAENASIGTSRSNPGLDSDMETWWRDGWGNSLTPDFELTPPAPEAKTYGLVIGTLYTVSTTLDNIDPSTPDLYYRAARNGTGTNLDQTVDMQGIFNYPPLGGWRAAPVPGATLPIEGQWYMNLRWFTSKGYSSTQTYHIKVGIDLTPPSAIASMVVSPSLNPADATSTIPTSRIHISWKPKSYDALSGVAYYQVYVDGSPSVPEATSNPVQGRVYEVPGVTPSSVTIENLSAGKHVIGLAAVDRATNVGPIETTTIFCDPDVPKIKITSPTGSTIGVKPTVAASATDAGGITSVKFALDGTPIAEDTVAPYSQAVDLSGFSAGQHILSATATDYYGRSVVATKSVTVNKTPLTLSSVTATGSGRKVTIKFKLNRAATAKVSLATAATSKTLTMSNAASYTYSYTYPKGKKYPSALSFYDTYTIRATDALGNVATVTGRVKVTLARIVKTATNQIKIIYY